MKAHRHDRYHALKLVALTLSLGAASSAARAATEIETGSRAGTSPQFSTENATGNAESESVGNRFSVNYTNIFYGPAISGASSYQPSTKGESDPNRPVYMKNFLSASYGITETIAATATLYWQYRPVLGQQLALQDPFARISHAQILYTDWGLNLYSDARVHFGVTDASRNQDLYTGLQNFSYLSWNIATSRSTVALRASARYNIYGKRGSGTDTEFYLAPEYTYQLLHNFAFTLLYEMGASHQFGDTVSYFTNDGTDLEPGVSWDITPSLNFNPYLNLFTGGKVTARSTSVGAFLSWNIL